MSFAAKTPPHMVTLVLLTGLSTVSLTMFLPSLSNIAADFQADYALVNLSVAGYLAVTAALQLIMGPLSDRYGRRPILLAGTAIFALASIGCALAVNVWMFLAFRLLQAAIVSGFALSKAVVGDIVPPREAASRMGYISMAMALAPILAPIAGGALDELFGWRATFLAFAAAGVAMFVICWFDLGETNKSRSANFSEQFRAYPELVRSRRYWGYALCVAFSTGAFYAFVSGTPLVAEAVLNVSPTKVGLYIGSITCGFLLGSFLSGRFAGRFPLTTMMITGRLAACGGLTIGLGFFLAGVVNEFTLFGATVFVGIGNGLTMPSANAGTIAVRPKLAGSAAGLSGALTVGSGALVTSATGAIIAASPSAHALVGIMLFCSAVGLAAALMVLAVDRREGVPVQS